MMTAPADLCTIQVSDAEYAYARQRWIFGCEPSGPLEAWLFEVFDANREEES